MSYPCPVLSPGPSNVHTRYAEMRLGSVLTEGCTSMRSVCVNHVDNDDEGDGKLDQNVPQLDELDVSDETLL